MAWTSIDLPPGLSSDDTPLALTGRFRDGSNVRFHNGRAEIVTGWERATTSPLTGVCRNVMPWMLNGTATLCAYGTHTNLFVSKSGVLTDITPEGLAPGRENGAFGASVYGDYFPRTWALANWGQDMVANPRGGGLYHWVTADGGKAVKVPNAPASAAYMLVTPQRQVLMFGANEELSGVVNTMCIRGSDLEDLTVWNTSRANNAFEHILDGSGRIVAARLFGDGVVVWTESRCFVGTFVGNAGQAYSFQEMHGAPGLLAPNAAVNTRDSLMWLTPELLLYTLPLGTTQPLQIDCPLQDDSLAHVNPSNTDKVVFSYLRATNEVRIDYPDARDARAGETNGRENSRFVALNTTDGSWSRGAQARAAFDGGIANPIGCEPRPAADGGVSTSIAYHHERGTNADGGPLKWSLETNYFALDDDETTMLVRGFKPDLKDQAGAAWITLFFADTPNGAEDVYGPYLIAPGDSRLDVMASGKLARFRLEGNSAPAQLRLGKPLFDITSMGTR